MAPEHSRPLGPGAIPATKKKTDRVCGTQDLEITSTYVLLRTWLFDICDLSSKNIPVKSKWPTAGLGDESGQCDCEVDGQDPFHLRGAERVDMC